MTANTEDDEYEYYNYGTQKDGSYIVGGGALVGHWEDILMNGNAYATVEKEWNKYYYCEYGENNFRKFIGTNIEGRMRVLSI